jgi:hypothetical protein
VKKDTHPAIRVEWRCLFDTNSREEAKPENAEKSVVVD